MPDHNEFFRGNTEEHYPDQMPELPSTEVTYTIRLNRVNIPDAEVDQLSTELWNDHNMSLSRSSSNKDIVSIYGIPPDNKFDEQKLLRIVRTYAPNARVI